MASDAELRTKWLIKRLRVRRKFEWVKLEELIIDDLLYNMSRSNVLSPSYESRDEDGRGRKHDFQLTSMQLAYSTTSLSCDRAESDWSDERNDSSASVNAWRSVGSEDQEGG